MKCCRRGRGIWLSYASEPQNGATWGARTALAPHYRISATHHARRRISTETHDLLRGEPQRILAVAGMNRDRDMAIWEERIRNNRIPSPDQLSEGRAESLNDSKDSSSFSAYKSAVKTTESILEFLKEQ